MRRWLPVLNRCRFPAARLVPVLAAVLVCLLAPVPGAAFAEARGAPVLPEPVRSVSENEAGGVVVMARPDSAPGAGERAQHGAAAKAVFPANDDMPAAEVGFSRDTSSPLLLAQAGQAREPQAGQGSRDVEALAEQRAAGQEGRMPSIRLFNTVEFRGTLKNMPKWQRVVTAEQRSRTFDGDLSAVMRPASVYAQWQQIVERVKGASDLEKAKAVSAFFNRWPYRTDQAVYKVADYWATPREFLKNSGDCEDYAIVKFYALVKLGVDPENMRVVALKDTIRNLAHAVLVLYTENDAYVLDNLTSMVLTHERYQHYLPQYSVNEVYRWAHVRPKKKK
ncbi:MAG: transglutaminase-like cysteine peptidase [Deltaproteobacteria bacterium]|nr:transglutaminase-like cysteine peptidase [Deltaproteobacteria bacterium]